MNVIDNICTAFTIGCSIYTSLTVYKNIKKKEVSVVEPYTEYEDEAFRNTRDYYETVVNIIHILNEILLRYLDKSFYMMNITLFSVIRK